ncbi:MAG TPA: arylesterase [Burkholderiaceae bacterium]|nr:arylesterase [Burkholderiaceae bacterium]
MRFGRQRGLRHHVLDCRSAGTHIVRLLGSVALALVLAATSVPVRPASEPSTAILVMGDSLSAEYGLPRETGWVKLLADRVAQRAPQYNVVNASISGDTTSGGRARLAELLQRVRPGIVIIELGANDGLRGLSIDAMRVNLQAMIDSCRRNAARVLLVGVRLPPNYGASYGERFFSVYGELAKRNRVALVPFLLDGFADNLDLFQADRIHPLAQAQAAMLDNVWPHLQPLLLDARHRGQ